VASGKALLASANTNLQGCIGLASAKARAGTLPVAQPVQPHDTLWRVLVKINLRIAKLHLAKLVRSTHV
jgi:uncharacterized protein YfaA (DUF2138 family)